MFMEAMERFTTKLRSPEGLSRARAAYEARGANKTTVPQAFTFGARLKEEDELASGDWDDAASEARWHRRRIVCECA